MHHDKPLKRILALDGGGVRGMFSLQILRRIERLFREELGRPHLVLADVFDMFAGTSTGAIIATVLAWGRPVEEIEELYTNHGREIFCRRNVFQRWRCKYKADSIARFFRKYFSEADGSAATLGSSLLRTSLVVVMRNASTGSTWPLSNNPHATFNDRSLGDCNLDIPIWQLLVASTAAPVFFPPEEIIFGKQKFSFVDGGVSPYCNPALIAVLMATLPQFKYCWPPGRQNIHLISVGTGSFRTHLPLKQASKLNVLDEIKFLIPSLIGSSVLEQDMLCRILGECIYGSPIDLEVGDLAMPTLLYQSEQKFSYVRYDQSFDGMVDPARSKPISLGLDDLGVLGTMQRLGREYAAAHVRKEHLYPRKGKI